MHSLHNKLFRNYKDWCESMRIAPCFMPYPQANDAIYGGGRGGSEKVEVRSCVRARSQQSARRRGTFFSERRTREQIGWSRLLIFFYLAAFFGLFPARKVFATRPTPLAAARMCMFSVLLFSRRKLGMCHRR